MNLDEGNAFRCSVVLTTKVLAALARRNFSNMALPKILQAPLRSTLKLLSPKLKSGPVPYMGRRDTVR